MSVQIPLILYDVDNNQIQYEFSSTGYTFFMRSYLDFDIRVLSGECIIYRVSNDPTTGEPIIIKSDKFIGPEATTSYTLFMKSDCIIQCGSSVYKGRLRIDNVFSEELDDSLTNEYPNSHYNELLVNYFLPTWEELEPAIFGNTRNDKAELIKRMLIDFRKIVTKKGTLKSIELFFKFVNLSGIKVYAEYAHQNPDSTLSKTVDPNPVTDWKTGDYHLLFTNWKQEDGNAGLNRKNMPIRKIHVEDLDEFFEKLVYAIALADKYFTLPEQEISFFGIKYSSNIPMFPGMRSNQSYIEFDDVHHFRKSIDVSMRNYYSSTDVIKLIHNTLQLSTVTYLSEVKVIVDPATPTTALPGLMWIEKEIYDDEENDGSTITQYKSIFGNVLHLDIASPNTYVDVRISSAVSPEDVFIHYDKKWCDQSIKLLFATTTAGNYNIVITVWDIHNNREVYNYKYYVDAINMIIDFETFNSVVVTDVDEPTMNKITLDVSSPATTDSIPDFFNYVLSQKDVPDDLSEYYDKTHQQLEPRNHIVTNKRFLLPQLNKNFVLDDITDTLPMGLLESYVEVYTYKYDPTKTLKLRIYDGELSEWVLIDYTDISRVASSVSDKIMVTVLDILEPNITLTGYDKVPYVFITTTEMGITIKTMYDFVLDDGVGGVSSLYSLDRKSLTHKILPVNYDYQLFIRPSELVPDFRHYISGIDLITEKTLTVKSLFPRLINISLTDKQTYDVELGDVICCRTNKNFISGESDIKWEIRNAFTNELMFETTDEMLKYRIEDNTVYTLTVTYKINGAVQSITKESIFSSFKVINN